MARPEDPLEELHGDGSPELFDFVHEYLQDEAAGQVQDLLSYQRKYPGLETAVEAEYRRLSGDTDPEHANPDEPDRQKDIGPYRLLHLLGSGGQGDVYAAWDARSQRQVALKVLRGGPFGTGREALARFHREAEIVSKLDDPSICPVYEADSAGGIPFIAMPLLAGKTLRAHFAQSPNGQFPIDRLLAIVESVARSLHGAHELGVVHRDVKPGNIMVLPDYRPILLDFGLARIEGGADQLQTQSGAVMGTPAYLAPEIVESGIKSGGVQADVYGLGVTLYEGIAGRLPHSAPTPEGLLRAIREGSVEGLRTARPEVTRDLAVLVATAMERSLGRRYRTAQVLAEELARVRAQQPILARPVSSLVRLTRWVRRRPAFAAALTCTVLGLITSLFFWRRAAESRDAYDLVAGAAEMSQLWRDADNLWPLNPEQAPALREWLEHARRLRGRLPVLEERLTILRARGTHRPVPAGRVPTPELLLTDAPAPPTALPDDWHFQNVIDQFQHDVLNAYINGLRRLGEPGADLMDRIDQRATYLETVVEHSLGQAKKAWDAAVAEIADPVLCPRYRGLRISPQEGLIPLGRNPQSGLHEFVDLFSTAADLRTQPAPKRSPSGKLELRPEHGVIFVLLPGGAAKIGSFPAGDPRAGPDDPIDPEGEPTEHGAWSVTLDPFFMSKFEITQAQWERITGRNPSFFHRAYQGEGLAELYPVEFVSWEEAELWARRIGWRLPTEAQWEYGARGGTLTPWYTGESRESLRGHANVAGAEFRNPQGFSRVLHEPWSDGSERPWMVGTGEPNGFGLHDVHGNVWEWCRDTLRMWSESVPEAGDGFRPVSGLGPVYRGGSWLRDAYWARCSARLYNRADYRRNEVGLRPVRRLDRSTDR